MTRPFACADETIAFIAERGSGQGGAYFGPFADFESAWREVEGFDTDRIFQVQRIGHPDTRGIATVEDITEDCATAWLRLNDDPDALRHAPAFIDRDEAEALFEHAAREAAEYRSDVRATYMTGRI